MDRLNSPRNGIEHLRSQFKAQLSRCAGPTAATGDAAACNAQPDDSIMIFCAAMAVIDEGKTTEARGSDD